MSNIIPASPTLALLFDRGYPQRTDLLTVTNSNGTRVNKFGQIEQVPDDTQRIDYDPVTGECLGVLIEEERTNSILDSRDITTGNWSSTATVARDAVGIDGVANTACTLTDTSSSTSQAIGQTKTIPNDSNPVLASIFIEKTNVENFPYIYLNLTGGTRILTGVQINTKKGTFQDIGTTLSFSGVNAHTLGVHDKGDYWLLYASILNNASGNVSCECNFHPASGNSLGDTTIKTGSAVVDQFQLELSASYPSSPIFTNGSPVTRLADDISITGTEFSTFYNQSEGSFIINTSPFYADELPYGVMSVQQSGNTGRDFSIIKSSNESIDGAMGGNYLSLAETNEYSFGVDLKMGFKSNGTSEDFYVNAVKTYSGNNGLSGNSAILHVGAWTAGSDKINGHLKSLIYYPKALDDNTLQFLTRQTSLSI